MVFFRWGTPTQHIHPKQPFTVPTHSVVTKPYADLRDVEVS